MHRLLRAGGLSALAAIEGNARRAMRLAGEAASVREPLGTQLPFAERQLLAHRLAGARQALGDGAAGAAYAKARGLGLEDVVAHAPEGLALSSNSGSTRLHSRVPMFRLRRATELMLAELLEDAW